MWERSCLPSSKEEFKIKDISYRMVQKIDDECGMYHFKLEMKQLKFQTSVDATTINDVWRTDLYNLSIVEKKITVIINDKSRYVVGWGVFETKASMNTEAV